MCASVRLPLGMLVFRIGTTKLEARPATTFRGKDFEPTFELVPGPIYMTRQHVAEAHSWRVALSMEAEKKLGAKDASIAKLWRAKSHRS